MTVSTHARYLARSGWSHLRPKRPFVPREDRIRLGGGIVLAALAGALIYTHAEVELSSMFKDAAMGTNTWGGWGGEGY